jgi:PUA domain protein
MYDFREFILYISLFSKQYIKVRNIVQSFIYDQFLIHNMKRKPLSKAEIKELNAQLESYNISFHKKERIDLVDDLYYVKDDMCIFFLQDDAIVPSLKFLLSNEAKTKDIIVDMGAVKFIVNGADVMRPGIQEIDPDIKKDDIVVIKDVNNKKPLVVGIAMDDAENLEQQKEGKSVINIHYVGDAVWNLEY